MNKCKNELEIKCCDFCLEKTINRLTNCPICIKPKYYCDNCYLIHMNFHKNGSIEKEIDGNIKDYIEEKKILSKSFGNHTGLF